MQKHSQKNQVWSYVIGFVLSLVLTLLAFGFVQAHLDSNHVSISHQALKTLLFVFAFLQLLVQLVFFLHLGREPKPRQQTYSFIFAIFIVIIFVIGSVWIMANLDYAHGGRDGMNPAENDMRIMQDEGIYN